MSYQNIRKVQQAVWPAVQKSLALHRKQRDAITSTSSVGAKARARVPWPRVIANETVWAAAKADLLCTPEHQAVIKAAREWAQSWPAQGLPSETDDPTDVALYRAVQDLALANFDIPDEEVLHIQAN